MKKTVMLLCISLFIIGGCDPIWTGIGIGTGASETLDFLEDNLEAKKIELARLYDEEIERMQNAADPNELAFSAKKIQQIQIAQAANLGASTLLQELKNKSTTEKKKGYLNLLHGLIPLAVGYAGIELKKRLALEKKRQAEKAGRELALREIASMDEKDITAPVVKEKIYRNIGDALRG